jgi:hypothetical protein
VLASKHLLRPKFVEPRKAEVQTRKKQSSTHYGDHGGVTTVSLMERHCAPSPLLRLTSA